MTKERHQALRNLYAGVEPQTVMIRHLEECLSEIQRLREALEKIQSGCHDGDVLHSLSRTDMMVIAVEALSPSETEVTK